jgi:WD40 repeat protein
LLITDLKKNSDNLSDCTLYEGESATGVICFNDDSTLLAHCTVDGIHLWDIATNKILFIFPLNKKREALSLKFNDNKIIMCSRNYSYGWNSCSIIMWDISKSCYKPLLCITRQFTLFAIDPLIMTELSPFVVIPLQKGVVVINTNTNKHVIVSYEEDEIVKYRAVIPIPIYSHFECLFCLIIERCDGSIISTFINGITEKVIATIPLISSSKGKKLTSAGITTNSIALFFAFEEFFAIKMNLLTPQQIAKVNNIFQYNDMLVYYLLLRLYKAKKDNKDISLHNSLLTYLYKITNKNSTLIKKYLC